MSSPLKLDLSLQQLAMTRVAISCWERPEIKKEINKFFLTNNDYHDIYLEAETRLHHWIWEVLHEFLYSDEELLPQSLRHELSYMIISVGRRLVRWLSHKAQAKMVKYHLDTVCWTPHGTIDEVKIFEMLYTNQSITDLLCMYEEACRLCLEDHVKDLWQKLSNEQKDRVFVKMDPEMWADDGDLSDFNIYLLMYWQVSDKKSHLFTETSLPRNFRGVYDFNQSLEANNFRLCAISGYETAAKYFFHQLTDTEKHQNCFPTASLMINQKLSSRDILQFSDFYYYVKFVDMLIFLMQKMSASETEELMNLHMSDVCRTLLFLWPWQSLFIQMVDQISNHLSKDNYVKLLKIIIDKIIFDGEYVRIKSSPMYQILLEVWAQVPVDVKKQIVKENFLTLFRDFLNKGEDILFLNHVINDPDLASKKQDLLKKTEDYFYDLLIDENFETVNKILKEVFLYTEEQCTNYRKTFDSSDIFEQFISEDWYEGLNEFLWWQFQNSEEVDNFKSNAKLNTCSTILCDIWKRDNHVANSITSKEFFQFFRYNENDKENLREQLVNSDDFKSTLRDFAQKGDREKFDGFLNCCEFSEEESARLKLQFPIQNIARRAVRKRRKIYGFDDLV